MNLTGRTVLRIDAAPDRVWERLTDVAGWKSWMPGVVWAVLEGGLAGGAYLTIKPERGRQTAYRVGAAVPPRLFALGLTFGPVAALRRTWTLESDGDATRATHTVETDGPFRRWLVAGAAARLHAGAPSMLEALAEAARADGTPPCSPERRRAAP